MAVKTYYVRPDGNNGNTGLGTTSALAYATIAKAVSMVAAGDTVIIAPGTYRETVTLATSGSVGNIITWWGDKEAQYFTDMKAGYVRITGTDSSEIGQSTGSIFNCNAKTYQTIRGFVIDGHKSGNNSNTYRGINGNSSVSVYDCVINAVYYGIYSCLVATRCIVQAYYAYQTVITANNCISVGAMYGFIQSTTINNCMCLGGQNGFYNSTTANNCTAFNCYYSYYVMTTITNCKAISCFYGFYGAPTINTSKAINCAYATYGNSLVTPINLAGVKVANCILHARGGGYDTGAVTEAKHEGYTDISRLIKIAHALKFDLFEANGGTATSFTEDYDIEGLPRRMGSGVIDMGCHEYSNNSISFTEHDTMPASFQINNIGTRRLVIAVVGGVSKTISCTVKFNLDSGTLKPQLVIQAREDILTTNPITVTATGTGSSYETLTTTFTPKASGMLFVEMRTQENGSGGSAVANFSNVLL